VNTETPCPHEQYAILDEREAVKQLLPWATNVECTEAGGTHVDEEEDVPCELNTEETPRPRVMHEYIRIPRFYSTILGRW
jgi:hypothetical protein